MGIFLIIFRDKQKNDAKHSLAAIEKKKQHSIRFLFFDQSFKYSLEIRNSLKTRSSAFFSENNKIINLLFIYKKNRSPTNNRKNELPAFIFCFPFFFNSSMTLKIRVSSALYNDYYT